MLFMKFILAINNSKYYKYNTILHKCYLWITTLAANAGLARRVCLLYNNLGALEDLQLLLECEEVATMIEQNNMDVYLQTR